MQGKPVCAVAVLVVLLLAEVGLGRPLADDDGSTALPQGHWMPSVGDGGTVPAGFGTPSNFATRAVTCYNGELYVGTQNVDFSRIDRLFEVRRLSTLGLVSYRLFEQGGSVLPMLRLAPLLVPLHGMLGQGCEIWRHDGAGWQPVVSDTPGAALPAGFGGSAFGASVLQPFKGYLYAGTAASSLRGCEVWQFDGAVWQRVAARGFGSRHNSGVWSSAVYRGRLYVGTMNWKDGCQVYRTGDGCRWEQVALPGGDGFGDAATVYAWSMGVYRDELYLGTCNLRSDGGAQLWRFDGSRWEQVALPGGDGFGDAANYGIRNLVVFRDELYVATGTSFVQRREGSELWRYDGRRWRRVAGGRGVRGDGFGDTSNKYIWSLLVVDDALWAGTLNLQPALFPGPFSSGGCEIWRYEGWRWRNVVGSWRGEMPGGFGDLGNVGARSMLEYPAGSGVIWVGTWQFDVRGYSDFSGCEIWRRVPAGRPAG